MPKYPDYSTVKINKDVIGGSIGCKGTIVHTYTPGRFNQKQAYLIELFFIPPDTYLEITDCRQVDVYEEDIELIWDGNNV